MNLILRKPLSRIRHLDDLRHLKFERYPCRINHLPGFSAGHYITRIANILTGSRLPDYPQRSSDTSAPSDPRSNAQLVETINTILSQRDLPVSPEINKEIDEAITNEEVDRLAFRVASEGADYPLEEIAAERTSRLIDAHSGEDYFEEDMGFLLRQGLIAASDPDYRDASITELGSRVVQEFAGVDPDFAFPQVDPPPRAEMEPLPVGQETRAINVTEPQWFAVTIEEDGTYQVDAVTVDGDPTIALYGPDGSRMAFDDDGGDTLWSSRIRQALSPGRYALEVNNLGTVTGEYELTVRLIAE